VLKDDGPDSPRTGEIPKFLKPGSKRSSPRFSHLDPRFQDDKLIGGSVNEGKFILLRLHTKGFI
jgi:hypothetical protein